MIDDMMGDYMILHIQTNLSIRIIPDITFANHYFIDAIYNEHGDEYAIIGKSQHTAVCNAYVIRYNSYLTGELYHIMMNCTYALARMVDNIYYDYYGNEITYKVFLNESNTMFAHIR